MKRESSYDIMDEILGRWSPRAFSDSPVPENDVMALLEAARFAPSCFNEQPWRFIVGNQNKIRDRIFGLLAETNRTWAVHAPVLIMILGKKTFVTNGKENFWSSFDAGTAWGYFSLEAERRGYITHAMGGFSKAGAIQEFALGEDLQPIAVVALGKPGSVDRLPEALRLREVPGTRKEIAELILFK